MMVEAQSKFVGLMTYNSDLTWHGGPLARLAARPPEESFRSSVLKAWREAKWPNDECPSFEAVRCAPAFSTNSSPSFRMIEDPAQGWARVAFPSPATTWFHQLTHRKTENTNRSIFECVGVPKI